ncbi:MAG: prolyl oligopeptidase family serine peptidase [Clostridia bacterium]|nr:prolyl oligopeptidase family serine peptidase [Clostridia bacterium]
MKENKTRRISRALSLLLLLVMVVSCIFCTPAITANAATGGGEGTWVTGNAKKVTSTWSYYRAGVDSTYSDYLYYDIYLPANYDESKEYSLLLMLHGSLYAQSSQYAFARFLKFNAVADANDIIVIYPRQSIDLNFTHSWNFWAHTDQCRTSGYTPATMVGYVKDAINTYSVNTDNVFVAGFSAGGAYAMSLLAMYPEVFKGACSSSGIPYKTTGCALDAVAAMYDNSSWGGYETNTNTLANYVNSAFSTAGVSEPRRLMVIHGTADSLVTYSNGERSTETWVKAMRKYDSSISLTPDVTETYTSAGGATYDMELYGGNTPETSVVAFYTVQGMDHAWSGATAGTTSYGFPLGPSTNELMWRFFTGTYNYPVETNDEITGSSSDTLPNTAISGSYNFGSGRKISNISTSTTFTLDYANKSPDYYNDKDPYYSAYFCYDLDAIMATLPEVQENYVRRIETITVKANVSKGSDANGYVSNAIIYYTTTSSAWTGTNNFPKSGYTVGDGTYGSDWTNCGNLCFDLWAEDMDLTNRYLTLKMSYEFGVWVMFPSYMTMTSTIPTITINYVDTYVEPVDPIQSVEYEINENDKLTFKVVTDAPYTEVKVMDSADVSVAVATSSTYTVNENGFNEFTMTIDAPKGLTMYYVDCGSNGVYLEQYYTCIVEGLEEDVEVPVVGDYITSVSHVIDGDEIVFSVVTKPADLNRVKVCFASDTSTYLSYVSNYTVDADGNYVWTIKTDAPTETTEYAFDVRNAATGFYTQDFYNYTVEIAVVEPTIKSVSYDVKDGKVVFTVVTASGNYNRLRVGPNTSTVGNLANTSNYTVDANGNYVWTISIDVPTKNTQLYFDLRDASTNKFIGECYAYYLDVSSIDDGNKIESVTSDVVDGKLVFTVVTEAGVDRVKVALASDVKSYIKYTNNYTVDKNGNYVFTISIAEPSETTEYAFDARDISTNKYTKKYAYLTYEYSNENESVISVAHKISGNNLIFEVVTKPVANRVKVSLTSDLGTYLKYTNDYTVDVNGNYVWSLTVAAPTAVTSYSFDSRNPNTSKYYKDYFEYVVDPSQSSTIPSDNSVIKYITKVVVSGKVEFNVTTAAGNYNRIKVSDTEGNLLDYVNNYTVDENGNYVWKLTIDAPASATTYVFDLRAADTNKYLKLAYAHTVTDEDLNKASSYLTPYVKSIDTEVFSSASNDKLVFTIVTTSEINRVKLAYASDPKSYIAYTSKYTVDGENYVWTISIDKPLTSTKFVVDVRVAGTSVYTRDYAPCEYILTSVDPLLWGKIDANGVYTFDNGGVQFDANGWLLYNQYGITLVASNGYPTSCVSISIYDTDDTDVFENKTVADFEATLGTTLSSFEKTTIGDKGYTCYIAKSADGAYFNYVFQTEFNKYFINFIQAADGVDVAAISEAIMDSIVIFY